MTYAMQSKKKLRYPQVLVLQFQDLTFLQYYFDPMYLDNFFPAFMCHHNSFLLYESIANTSITKWKKVTHVSISISFIMMVSMALGGYATFTGQAQGRDMFTFSFKMYYKNT